MVKAFIRGRRQAQLTAEMLEQVGGRGGRLCKEKWEHLCEKKEEVRPRVRQVSLIARGCLLLSTGVCAEEMRSQNFVCCDPHCRQSLSPHRLTPPLAISAEDLLLICKLNDIKNFSSSQRQVLPSAPLLHRCRVNHHLSQDVDASFKLKHKQQHCSSAGAPGEHGKSRPLSSQMVCRTGLMWGCFSGGNRTGPTWVSAGLCRAQLPSAIALHPSQGLQESLEG